jgi:cytochrome P450 PksS
MDQPTGAAMFDAAFKARAFPIYAAMRDKGPVARVELPDGRILWLVTRFAEASEMLKDHGRFANDPLSALTEEEYGQLFQQLTDDLTPEQQELVAETDEILSRNLLGVDPPDHSRLRRLVAIPFTPRYIESLRPRIEAIAGDLLDAIEARACETGHRQVDLIDAFAYPLPLTVIAEMLGIPQVDRAKFREWSQAAVAFTPADPANPELTGMMIEFVRYLRQLAAEKRAHPSDDLLSGLVQAEAEGDKLSENELLAMIFVLIVAGHETTVNLIANGLLALFDHPEQYARLRADLSQVPVAIEEMLRYAGPVEMSLTRWVRQDTELGGERLRRGEEIVALLASDNRDERQFPDAETFDITREPGRSRHLAFGTGIHACLGSALARLEGQIAFTALLSRLPNLALATPRDAVEWRAGTFLRGLTRLPVTF